MMGKMKSEVVIKGLKERLPFEAFWRFTDHCLFKIKSICF